MKLVLTVYIYLMDIRLDFAIPSILLRSYREEIVYSVYGNANILVHSSSDKRLCCLHYDLCAFSMFFIFI